MKNHSMKKKLMATSLMLVISILMMSTASFAWFTISTAPEITGMETDVVVNDNLEIALAAEAMTTATPPSSVIETNTEGAVVIKQTHWGNMIDLNATDVKDAYDALEKTLRPVKLNSAKTGFEYPTYGANGRVSGFGSCTPVNNGDIQFGNIKDGNGHLSAYYVDIWLRTNVAGTISLTSDAVNRGAGTNGSGSYLDTSSTNATADAQAMFADNLQVAWQILGVSKPTYTNGANPSLGYSDVTPAANATITNFTKTAVDGDKTKYNLSGEVITVTNSGGTYNVNDAVLVRVYVYLDGTNMFNMGASTTGTDFDITGALNLQFKHSATLTPMPIQPATGGNS